MTIKNVEDLRNHLLRKIEAFDKGEIKSEELAVIAKATDSIVNTVKLQVFYGGARRQVANIDFVQDCHKEAPPFKRRDAIEDQS
jgi:hypothetical protein